MNDPTHNHPIKLCHQIKWYPVSAHPRATKWKRSRPAIASSQGVGWLFISSSCPSDARTPTSSPVGSLFCPLIRGGDQHGSSGRIGCDLRFSDNDSISTDPTLWWIISVGAGSELCQSIGCSLYSDWKPFSHLIG